jgi:hypothetical protein
MNLSLKCLIVPPLVASRYTCGTSCIAPVTILWLASCVSILFGFLGGPMGRSEISWPTISVGIVLWLASGCWTVYATKNNESCRTVKKN